MENENNLFIPLIQDRICYENKQTCMWTQKILTTYDDLQLQVTYIYKKYGRTNNWLKTSIGTIDIKL